MQDDVILFMYTDTQNEFNAPEKCYYFSYSFIFQESRNIVLDNVLY